MPYSLNQLDAFMYKLCFKFILGLNFIFLLFLGMVVCDNEFETMEKIYAKDKIETQHKHNHNGCLHRSTQYSFPVLTKDLYGGISLLDRAEFVVVLKNQSHFPNRRMNTRCMNSILEPCKCCYLLHPACLLYKE